MSTPKFNSKSPTIKRILREASELSSSPSSDYHASPASDSNLFEWHFTLRGPPSSAFAAGIYHGRIILPPTYPLRPPSFRFLTPSGRFETNREICLSISGHHEETWQPAWGIRTALVALRAFMETDAKGQLGGLDTSESERRRCAEGSGGWKCGTCGRSNKDILEECAAAAKLKEDENGGGSKQLEDEVPKELTMAYKDTMSKNDESSEGRGSETLRDREGSTGSESAELAEGFVQTSPTASTSTTITPAYPAARPAQGVPQPTGSASGTDSDALVRNLQQRNPATTAAPALQMRVPTAETRRSTDGVPIWIDRAIAGVVLCLLFMVVKMLAS